MKQILILGFCLVLLSACTNLNTSTQFMPNGYYYQGNNRPITNPAPSRPWFSETKTNANGKSNGASFNGKLHHNNDPYLERTGLPSYMKQRN